ncbi:acyl-CoA/acyl-ACP dehydrogenase [Leptothermofonsia sichuanensis E412]|uniref:acyl-CoA dehydrogenase family protein n=1 Tax=Leptothermofonsia sichuanensis TaxID=2917832 RepID=UPI001CA605BE|nr:acyl-CoA dehydrogenase family protein [Leptothermofonsia sichuanensis]QZZ21626.1 acyl-CoA/acyl-ACP dehydrogenase [Leptothermofonsia sichuanensis E412]
MESSTLIENVEYLLRTEIAPKSAEIDCHPAALQAALQVLGKASLLALRVPHVWGGREISEFTFQCFQEQVARYSGALAFLQAQHQSAGTVLSRSENADLKRQYLPGMGCGQALVGISFAHLRRSPPPVTAVALADGYLLNGELPWVTGYGFFQTFIGAAVLPDGQAVYGMLPFQTTEQATGGKLTCSEPMALAAMNATQTVTVHCQNWLLPKSEVVKVSPVSAVAVSDRLNVLHHSFFALGCARAGLDILTTVYQTKPLPFIQLAQEALETELAECRQSIFSANPDARCFEQNLQLRAWAIELAVRCAHAAIAASGGSANGMNHPAQRVYREALVYTVSGQTTAVMEATLTRIQAPGRKAFNIRNSYKS